MPALTDADNARESNKAAVVRGLTMPAVAVWDENANCSDERMLDRAIERLEELYPQLHGGCLRSMPARIWTTTIPHVDDAMTIEVTLPAEFTQKHASALGQYSQDETRLQRAQWELVWEGVDILRSATIIVEGRTLTFTDVYDRVVDRIYADSFIEALYQFDDMVHEAEQRRAAVARQIVVDLRNAGFYDPVVPDTQLVLVFCLYWWQSFSKGYAFEVEIPRDLTASGIQHQAHDLRDRQARLSSFDLMVMGFRGDIKTSTYFFAVERSRGLPHDFYITRLWNRQTGSWQKVVMLKPAFWAAVDGETRLSALDDVLDILPGVAEIRVGGQELVVVEYEAWKERVKVQQERGE